MYVCNYFNGSSEKCSWIQKFDFQWLLRSSNCLIGILLDLWPHDDIFMETISEYLLTLHCISTLHSWLFKWFFVFTPTGPLRRKIYPWLFPQKEFPRQLILLLAVTRNQLKIVNRSLILRWVYSIKLFGVLSSSAKYETVFWWVVPEADVEPPGQVPEWRHGGPAAVPLVLPLPGPRPLQLPPQSALLPHMVPQLQAAVAPAVAEVQRGTAPI